MHLRGSVLVGSTENESTATAELSSGCYTNSHGA